MSKVSFTVRRPTPVSRSDSGADDNRKFRSAPTSRGQSPLVKSRTYDDSSDEDDKIEDELVTGFDEFGVQRLHQKKKAPTGPLVIPALQNRDWRELARKRKAGSQYVPPSAQAQTGADGSVGGLGTKDSINSGPQLSGLHVVSKKVKLEERAMEVEEAVDMVKEEEKETEDQRALRAILAGTDGAPDGPIVDVIPQRPMSETDALRQDVVELPDQATLDDYERIPISQYGAALLRGMGWKDGSAASKKGKGPIEPYLPTARPALLGIGAKEREVLDDGSRRKGNTRPERRYVPVVKVERSGGSGSSSRRHSRSPGRGSTSRRGSRSPPRRHRGRDDRYEDRYRDKDDRRDHDRDDRRDRDYDKRDRDHDRERYRDQRDREKRRDRRD